MSDVNSILSEFVDINSMVDEVEKKEVKKFWRPNLPKTTIRVLPPIKANGEKLPFFEHRVHWINGQPYECLNQTVVDKDGNLHNAEPCPLCKMTKALYNAKTDEATELAKQISAKTRYVSRVVVRDDKTTGDNPVFYELPFSIYDKFKTAILSKEWGSLVGPLDGRDMDIVKTGEGKFTKYDASSFKPTTSPIFQDTKKIVETLQQAKDVSYNSLISFSEPEELKSVAMENDDIARFFGGSPIEAKPISKPQTVTGRTADAVVEPLTDEDLGIIPQTVDTVIGAPIKEENTSSSQELDDLLASLV